jgi:hypothetical protein
VQLRDLLGLALGEQVEVSIALFDGAWRAASRGSMRSA